MANLGRRIVQRDDATPGVLSSPLTPVAHNDARGGVIQRKADPSESASRQPASERVLRTQAALARAHIAVAAGQTRELFDAAILAHAEVPEEWLWLRLRVAGVLQAAFRFTGHADALDRGVELCVGVADRLDRPQMAILARGILGSLQLLPGRFFATVEACDAAIDLARAVGLGGHRFLAMAHQFRGYVRFEWNNLEGAKSDLERAWELAGPKGRGVRSGVARLLAGLAAAQGDLTAADFWFDRLEQIVSEPLTLRNREWLAAVRIRHGMQRERDLREIDQWQQRYRYDADALTSLDPQEAVARLQEFEHLLTVLESAGQWDPIASVARVLEESSKDSRQWFEVRALTFQAVAHFHNGRRNEGDLLWRDAMSKGRSGGYVRAFIEGCPARATMLERGLAGESREDALRILTACGHPSANQGPRLTPKQTEALRLVASGLSNRQIASSMEVSETTVKTHLRHIYRRLNVSSRTAAVAAGRTAGLV